MDAPRLGRRLTGPLWRRIADAPMVHARERGPLPQLGILAAFAVVFLALATWWLRAALSA